MAMSRPVRLALIMLPVVAGLALGGWYLFQKSRDAEHTGPSQPPPSAKPAGKLVVLVVFDQMRGDYLDRWADAFGPDGFERIKKDGVWYSDCHLPYACSSTAPGHASISTGAPPSVHGLVENDWYDRSAAARVYCVQPLRPYERVPPLRVKAGAPTRGEESGFSPERLLAPTVADALLAARGNTSRVFSLSIKDRTAVLMGGKTPTGAYCFDTRDGEFHTGAYYRESVHPWVEEFNASKTADRWFGTTWDRLRPQLDYTRLAGPDDAPGEAFGFHGQGRGFPHPFAPKADSPGKEYYTALETSPFGNDLLLELVKKAITAENLGRGPGTDLLCVSFSSTDLVGHQWGPDSWEVLDVTLRADRVVADFLKFLDETPGKDRYTMVITADHGICPIPEQGKIPTARRVNVIEVFRTLGAALDETFGKEGDRPGQWFEGAEKPDRVWPWFHLNRALLKARGIPSEAACDFVAQWLGNRPYLEAAFTRGQIETGKFPPGSLGERVKLAYHPDRCGDVIAIPNPGVLVTPYEGGTSHGSPHPYDTHVPVLVYGAGVPALGKRGGRVSSLVVAPTLAWALGIDPPAAAVGKVPAELTQGP
jgi:hypothetical protein